MSEVVSIYRDIYSVKDPVYLDLQEYLDRVRDGYYQDFILALKKLKSKEEQMQFKKKMPTVSLSGKFSKRSDDSLLEHNGILALDLDDVEDIEETRQIIESDLYTYACFYSAGGNGLRVLYKINSSKHEESFYGICEYLNSSYSITSIDPNGKNVSKPYIVSWDPSIYINEKSIYFKSYVKTRIEKSIDVVYSANDFDYIIKQIDTKGINICENYQEWVKVGLAISEQYGAAGEDYFHVISRQSKKYNRAVCSRQYKYCLKSKGSGKATIKSFYYLAKIAGIRLYTEETKKIIRITNSGKKAGLSKEQIIINLEKFQGVKDASDLVSRVYEEDYDIAEAQDDSNIIDSLELFLSNNYSLRYNVITGFIENFGKPIDEMSMNSIYISCKKIIPKLDYNLMIRLLKSDFVDQYNPLLEFLGSDGTLPNLDGSVRLNKGFSHPNLDKLEQSVICIGYNAKHFIKNWYCGIISSIHSVHSPLTLCLVGDIGTGKTEFFRRLLPRELNEYYAESKLDKGKDDEILMCEKILIMDDEFGGKSKQDVAKLKSLTSSEFFYLRRPYGQSNERMRRLAVLCGTSNPVSVLNDPTGNRRIIPIRVHKIDFDLYNSINKKELMMEAYELLKNGFDWRIIQDQIKVLEMNTDMFRAPSKERELLLKYFSPEGGYYMTTSEILVLIERETNQRISISTLNNELQGIGFETKSINIFGDVNVLKWNVKRLYQE